MRTFFQKGRTFFAAVLCAVVLTSCMEDEIVNPIDDSSIDARFTTSPTSGVSAVVGLSSTNELYTISATVPAKVTGITPISGVKNGATIMAIDFRPSTGQLYGLSSDGYLYVINRTTGVATAVNQTAIPLTGTQFGFDFNPRNDMISIVSDKGQSIAVNPSTGAVVATFSTTAFTGVNSTAFFGSGATTSGAVMYDISGTDYKLYAQNEKTGAMTTIGSTGLIITGDGGFDITRSGAAFAIFTARAANSSTGTWSTSPDDMSQDASRLFSVNLKTGAVTNYGKVGNNMIGVAVM